MLGDFFTYLASEASVIADAPVIFAMAVLASAAIVWWLANLRFGGVIDSQRERLHSRDEKIADYKIKLEGAEPEEARAHIKDLEARLARLEPRRLTDTQQETMSRHLAAAAGVIDVVFDGACVDGRAFSAGFGAVFQKAGWRVGFPMVFGIGDPPATGLKVTVKDLNRLSEADHALFTAMDASGLRYDRRGGLHSDEYSPRTAELLITSQA